MQKGFRFARRHLWVVGEINGGLCEEMGWIKDRVGGCVNGWEGTGTLPRKENTGLISWC